MGKHYWFGGELDERATDYVTQINSKQIGEGIQTRAFAEDGRKDVVRLVTPDRFKVFYLQALGLIVGDVTTVGLYYRRSTQYAYPLASFLTPNMTSFDSSSLRMDYMDDIVNWDDGEEALFTNPQMVRAMRIALKYKAVLRNPFWVDAHEDNWRIDAQGRLWLTDPFIQPDFTERVRDDRSFYKYTIRDCLRYYAPQRKELGYV